MNLPFLHRLLALAKSSGLARVGGSVGINEPDFTLFFNTYRHFICQTVSDRFFNAPGFNRDGRVWNWVLGPARFYNGWGHT
jgi:hypothetical protein